MQRLPDLVNRTIFLDEGSNAWSKEIAMSNQQTPNDQRSDVKNPNNPQYDKDIDNRVKQGHKNVPPPDPQAPQKPKK